MPAPSPAVITLLLNVRVASNKMAAEPQHGPDCDGHEVLNIHLLLVFVFGILLVATQ